MFESRTPTSRVENKKAIEGDLGFKLPNLDNWLEPDTVWYNFVKLTPNCAEPFKRYEPADWLSEVNDFEIVSSAPREIRSLFEVARSAIIYGYLCYPLLVLGAEQLHRVIEASARKKTRSLGWLPANGRPIRDDQPSFRESISYLQQCGLIAPEDSDWWNAAVELRNEASHPKMQFIRVPADALAALHRTAECINHLFGDSAAA